MGHLIPGAQRAVCAITEDTMLPGEGGLAAGPGLEEAHALWAERGADAAPARLSYCCAVTRPCSHPGCLQARTKRPARGLSIPQRGVRLARTWRPCRGLRPCRAARPPAGPSRGVRFFSLLLSSPAVARGTNQRRRLAGSSAARAPSARHMLPRPGRPDVAPAVLCFFPVFPCHQYAQLGSACQNVRRNLTARHPLFSPTNPPRFFASPAVDRRHRGGNSRRNSAAPPHPHALLALPFDN